MQSLSCQVHLADAVRMPEVKAKSVHLVVTSPPYPKIEMWDDLFAKQGAKSFEEMHALLARTWKECKRVLVDGGILAVNIGDAVRRERGVFRLFPNQARVVEHCEKLGFVSLPYILWKKPTNKPNAFLGSGFLPPNAYVTLDCEFILLFRKGGPRKYPANDEVRKKSAFSKKERDTWFSQIWSVGGARQNQEGVARRTAAFPSEVPRRLIRMFSCTGETVLDPFAGTGTTLAEAVKLKRNAVGYEVDEGLHRALKEHLKGFEPVFISRT